MVDSKLAHGQYDKMGPVPQEPLPQANNNTSILWQNDVPPSQVVAQPVVKEEHEPDLTPEPNTYLVTGTSVVAPDTVHDQNGRTYQGYREGKYFLPNDPVRILSPSGLSRVAYLTHPPRCRLNRIGSTSNTPGR
jgi:hypothetical protein